MSLMRSLGTPVTVGLISLAAPAFAGAEGRIEINQVDAAIGGVTPGDAPGFPVTLDRPGSYVLTGNLATSDVNESALRVLADGVTIDLAGFQIEGPALCSGSGETFGCSSGSGSGIDATGRQRTAIHGGTIRGFADYGVRLGDASRVFDLRLRRNGRGGVIGSDRCIARSVHALENDGAGIDLGHSAVVVDSLTHRNAEAGIEGDFAAVLIGNASQTNGGDGLSGLFGGNVIHANTAVENAGNGIRASDGALVTRNVLQANETRNLFLNASAGYARNVITSTASSPVTVVGGVALDGNLCDNGACP
ncbi:MAG: hypothetical protein AAGC67_21375 [Myxococcota bacterium]